MKNKLLLSTSLFLFFILYWSANWITETLSSKEFITFVTSAEYPPFEYSKDGEMVGFDIDLAKLIAQELKKDIQFLNMPFNTILPALSSNMADAAIATITITPERLKSFDLSHPYYHEKMAIIYPENNPIKNAQEIKNKIIACQLGTTMELWLKQKTDIDNILLFDSNNIGIEALKSGHCQGVVIDVVQADSFCKINKGLSYSVLEKSNSGYGIALKKDSPLTSQINEALYKLQENGSLNDLIEKWLEVKHV